VSKLIVKKTRTIAKGFQRVIHPIPDTQLNIDMKTIQQSGTKLSILVADTDPGWGLLADACQLPVPKFLKKFGVQGRTIPDSNHTFSRTPSRLFLADQLKHSIRWSLENEK
jgi:hypothetical protein